MRTDRSGAQLSLASRILKLEKMTLQSSLWKEIKLFLLFSWRDWSVTIIPGTIFACGFLQDTSSYPVSLIIRNYALVSMWLSLFIYSFNLSTQCYSIEEDLINKPDRPLPSGKISLEGARKRLLVVRCLLVVLVLYKPCIMMETICEVAATVFLCRASPRIGGHWFIKNTAMMTVMNWPLLSVPWKLMSQPSPVLAMERHIPTICLWVGIVAYAQDFRDQEGDKAMGRMTLPLAYSDTGARLIYAFGMLPVALLLLWQRGVIGLAPWVLVASHGIVGFRILVLRDKRQDHKSYMLITYICCFLVVLSTLENLEFISRAAPLEYRIMSALIYSFPSSQAFI